MKSKVVFSLVLRWRVVGKSGSREAQPIIASLGIQEPAFGFCVFNLATFDFIAPKPNATIESMYWRVNVHHFLVIPHCPELHSDHQVTTIDIVHHDQRVAVQCLYFTNTIQNFMKVVNDNPRAPVHPNPVLE